jgi:tetraacyldisaccharide-1-P 4'-kinase
MSALRRAGVVVLTQKGRDEDTLDMERRLDPFLAEPPVRVCFAPGRWRDLAGKPARGPERDYLAVAGVGDPGGFARILLEATGRPGELLAFPDHHPYSWGDVQGILDCARGRVLVTTEKDAVKLAAFGVELQDTLVLCLEIEVLEGEERLWGHVAGVLEARGPVS